MVGCVCWLAGRAPTSLAHRAGNVCVSPLARRQGVAKQLVAAAFQDARLAGVQHLYVHVERENEAAHRLYLDCSFSLEQEESANAARSLNRPRRLLLHRPVL